MPCLINFQTHITPLIQEIGDNIQKYVQQDNYAVKNSSSFEYKNEFSINFLIASYKADYVDHYGDDFLEVSNQSIEEEVVVSK